MIKNAIVSFLLVCLLLWLPFDLQFKSPFIPIERLKVKVSPEGNQANRVVLITVDGMIAKSMKFNITPFLFQKIQDGGRMGYSWTKAPVESRPAHQAILGGFWEDPSNILRLWRRSKGNEDHILKIIPNVLALGGPDVVEFFNGDDVEATIRSFQPSLYNSVIEVSDLDRWVINELKKEDSLSDYKLVFCHLAGVDTAGHRYGSTSQIYQESIKNADTIIREIAEMFPTDKTNFIVMSDHGFSIKPGFRRRHDLSQKESKRTPLILWGPDLNRKDSHVGPEIPDQKHVNICSLICSLLNIQLPRDYSGDLNSIGITNFAPEKKIKLSIMHINTLLHQLGIAIRGSFGYISYKLSNSLKHFENNTQALGLAMETQPNSYKDIQRLLNDSVGEILSILGFWRTRLKILGLIMCISIGLLFSQSVKEPLDIKNCTNPNAASTFTGLIFLIVSLFLSAPTIYYLFSLFLFVAISSSKIKFDELKCPKEKVIETLIEYSAIFLIFNRYCIFFVLLLWFNNFKFKSIEVVSLFLSLASNFVYSFYPSKAFELGAKMIAVLFYIFLHMSREKLFTKHCLSIYFVTFAILTLATLFPILAIPATMTLLALWLMNNLKLLEMSILDPIRFGLIPILACSLVNSQVSFLCLFIVLASEKLTRVNHSIPIPMVKKPPKSHGSETFYFWAIQALIFFPNGFKQSLTELVIRIFAIMTLKFTLYQQYHYWAFGSAFSLFMMNSDDEQWHSMTIMLLRHFYVVLLPFILRMAFFIFNYYSLPIWNKK